MKKATPTPECRMSRLPVRKGGGWGNWPYGDGRCQARSYHQRTSARLTWLALVGPVALFVLAVFSRPVTNCAASDVPRDWNEVQSTGSWCGAKCLALLARAYGRQCELEDVLKLCNADARQGGRLSIGELERVARALGLITVSLKGNNDWLDEPSLPAIALVSQPKTDFNHYIVIVAADTNRVSFIDPFYPVTVSTMGRDTFERRWTGHLLLVRCEADVIDTSAEDVLLLALDAIAAAFALVILGRRAARGRLNFGLAVAIIGSAMSCSGCGEAHRAATEKLTLEFEEPSFDNGILRGGGSNPSIEHSFVFKNKSRLPVEIGEVRHSCSCAVSSYPKEPIPSASSGVVAVRVDLTGREGWFNSYAVVCLKKPVKQEIVLELRQFITPIPAITPDRLDFGEIAAGSAKKRTATVRVFLAPDETDPEISLRPANAAIAAQLVPHPRITPQASAGLGEGIVRLMEAPIQIAVTPEGVAGTELNSNIAVLIGHRRAISVPVHAVVVDRCFQAEPRVVMLGRLNPNGELRAQVTLHSTLSGLQEEELLVEAPPGIDSSVRIDETDPSRLLVSLDATKYAEPRLAGVLQIFYHRRLVYSLRCFGAFD